MTEMPGGLGEPKMTQGEARRGEAPGHVPGTHSVERRPERAVREEGEAGQDGALQTDWEEASSQQRCSEPDAERRGLRLNPVPPEMLPS